MHDLSARFQAAGLSEGGMPWSDSRCWYRRGEMILSASAIFLASPYGSDPRDPNERELTSLFDSASPHGIVSCS